MVLKAAQSKDRPSIEEISQNLYHIPEGYIKDLYEFFPPQEQEPVESIKPEVPFGRVAPNEGDTNEISGGKKRRVKGSQKAKKKPKTPKNDLGWLI